MMAAILVSSYVCDR